MSESEQTLNPALTDALQVLTNAAVIPFTQYVRRVLPLDGYVFWLRTETVTFSGSLHVSIEENQAEDESISINQVVFSTKEEIQRFNQVNPDVLWVGEWDGIKFAFSRRGAFFDNAGLFHYMGNAVYPAMESQLVEVGSEFPDDTLIVSNSLPAWLTLKTYSPAWLVAPNPGVTLYPSFAVPDNIVPPYGAVHIAPATTNPIGAFPVIGPRGQHTQLTTDHVRVTLYGLTNARALAFQDLVNQYSLDTDAFGMMGMPIVRDEKRTQTELGILAMKKTIEFDVSYYQSAMPDVARQLIREAIPAFLPQPYEVP